MAGRARLLRKRNWQKNNGVKSMKISELFAESRKADSNEKRSIQKAFDKN
jgi:hypothetical protein